MTDILIPVAIVAIIGVLAGLGLAIASIVFAVPVDEKAEQVRECLPGANCGACGFSGCDGYAAALSKGETTECNLCTPGGNDVATDIAEIMGLEAGSIVPKTAMVMCQGIRENVGEKLEYSGAKSCKMAAQLFGGPKDCIYGCIGFGDCEKVCPYGAISMCNGIARIDSNLCKACKKCVSACPRNLIDLFPIDTPKSAVLCKNHDKGGATRKQCKTGCIGCMKCVKACEVGAVKINNFCAEVDYDKCTGCKNCVDVCPVGCINILDLVKN
ncbi:MAG: RnfABCDGE type electron transport complex subunit B [Clostridia bacterium]